MDRVIILLKRTVEQNPTLILPDPTRLESCQICFSTRNHCIRSLFQKIVSLHKWHLIGTRLMITLTGKGFGLQFLLIKYDISFQIIHTFYLSKIFLQSFNKSINIHCSFHVGNLEDIFFYFGLAPSLL